MVCAGPSCLLPFKPTDAKEISFHRFPTGLLGSLWLHTCGMKDTLGIVDHVYICSTQFQATDFEPAAKNKQSETRLLHTALPSCVFDGSGQRIQPTKYGGDEQVHEVEQMDDASAEVEPASTEEVPLKCAVANCPHIRGDPGSLHISLYPFPRGM
ncbi:hypothetical protein RvY_10691 [Ramazzottius varieornatus]|uniref:THAP-type domain-containing protein n=1 Tax=Ramazzottius varieornatus TaxID=947166 RepID=A0A1D1VG16_RAMVA|nr:hypothetical protein RvY_10691 [Ramazzottius varieornatus]